MSEETTPLPLITQKPTGRPRKEVWEHFTKGVEKSKGHYHTVCNWCKTEWNRGVPSEMEAHLASHCPSCPPDIRREYMEKIANRKEFTSTEYPSQKKQKANITQAPLSKFYESTELTEQRTNEINRYLLIAFVCCNIPYSIIESPFFVEALKHLRPGYNPPSREFFSGRLLDNEIVNINLKVETALNFCNDLTLGLHNFIFIIIIIQYFL